MNFERLIYLLKESHETPAPVPQKAADPLRKTLMELQRKLSFAFTHYTRLHNSRAIIGTEYNSKIENHFNKLKELKDLYYSFVERHRAEIEQRSDLLKKIEEFKTRNPLIFNN